AAEPMLAEVATSYCMARRDMNLALAGMRALATGKPVSLTAFDRPELRAWIARVLAERPIDTIFVFSGQMGQYVPSEFAGRVVIDLCDVDSAKFDAYAADRSGPRSWIDAREGRLLAIEEQRLVRRADSILLVSEAEADLLHSRLDKLTDNVMAVGNGIDTTFFDPQSTGPHPALACLPGPHLVFTGQMDYAPNVAAAVRAARSIMPLVRDWHPQAMFHVVGRAPTAEVRALEGISGTKVWGEVPDVRPFLAAADVVLVPLSIARGVQNKVLEAMAMARPVVMSVEAETGIGGRDGVTYAIATDDVRLAEAAQHLLSSGPRALAMAAAARRFVVSEKSWGAALAPLKSLVGSERAQRDAA
ncbi:MAG: TIGR03087 family PEP-CTERM/XrtA system glycosyltransferase, partial [Tsuneonella sp.]